LLHCDVTVLHWVVTLLHCGVTVLHGVVKVQDCGGTYSTVVSQYSTVVSHAQL